MRLARAILSTSVLAATLAAATGCHRKAPNPDGDAPGASSAEPTALPPLVFKDDTPNALLTWVDPQGDFHVVAHVADVPDTAREAVRVVLADHKDGTGESVYVADLRAKGPDGAYPVKSMSRASWDEIGASKRKARLEALAPSAAPPEVVAGAAPAASGSAGASTQKTVTAIIYGASWCGPCHQAEAFLKSLGVKVTKKDIEESDDAAREMQTVLRRAHRSGGSIPVIDVMGQVFVGFSDGALRAAVERARAN